MTLMNLVNYCRRPENLGMCAIYSSVKLLNLVTWNEWHAVEPRSNGKDEEERGNEQDDNDKEE